MISPFRQLFPYNILPFLTFLYQRLLIVVGHQSTMGSKFKVCSFYYTSNKCIQLTSHALSLIVETMACNSVLLYVVWRCHHASLVIGIIWVQWNLTACSGSQRRIKYHIDNESRDERGEIWYKTHWEPQGRLPSTRPRASRMNIAHVSLRVSTTMFSTYI